MNALISLWTTLWWRDDVAEVTLKLICKIATPNFPNKNTLMWLSGYKVVAIPIKWYAILEIQFVMSIINATFWMTYKIAAGGIAWCCHASVRLQWTTVVCWILLHSLLLKCVFFLLYVFVFLSNLHAPCHGFIVAMHASVCCV